MKLKAFIILIYFICLSSFAEEVRPNENLEPIDVIQIQLKALKDNDTPKADAGIKQTWLFAHPKNN